MTDKKNTSRKRTVQKSTAQKPTSQMRKISYPDGREIVYELVRKPVKNINIHVKSDGRILVSAHKKVPLKYLDNLMRNRQDFIFGALAKYDALRAKRKEKESQGQVILHDEKILLELCQKIHLLFVPMGVAFPKVKIRTMKTQWGSCRPETGVITLNRRLLEMPVEAIEYVVLHEFAHFIHPNHSKDFYALVEAFMPDWKAREKMLKEVLLG